MMPSHTQLFSVKARSYMRRFTRIMSTSTSGDHLQRTAANTRNQVIADAEVTEIKNLSPSVKLLKLCVDNRLISFKAGQWVDMFIPGVKTVGGFSMSSPPHMLSESSSIHLAVKYAKHPPAFWIHTKCQVGSRVGLKVGGDFYYAPTPESKPQDLLLLAGGVGINPLFSMLQHFVHCQRHENFAEIKGRSAAMLYSARNEEDLIFKDELVQIAEMMNSVNLRLFSSREKSSDPKVISNGRIHVTDIKWALSMLNAEETSVYLCGPLPFIEAMKSHCNASGVLSKNVHYESWW